MPVAPRLRSYGLLRRTGICRSNRKRICSWVTGRVWVFVIGAYTASD